MKSRMTALLIGATAIALVAVAPALAKSYGTQVKNFSAVQNSPDTVRYSGKVKSSKEKCKKGRRVEIYHRGIKIAETVTDEEGNFEVNGPVPPVGDEVEVRVKKKKLGPGKKCKPASDTTTFPTPQN